MSSLVCLTPVCLLGRGMLATALMVGTACASTVQAVSKTFLYYQLNAVEGRHLLFQCYIRQRGGSYVPAQQSLIACAFHMDALRCALLQIL